MKTTIIILFLALVSFATTRAEDKAPENPVAAQFRKHLEDADKNKEGYVTREELVAEIGKDPKRDPQTVEKIVSAMMRDLDTDHDGKLSPAEIANGARKVGQNASTKQDVNRAQLVMDALIEYKKGHDGA